MAKLVIELPPWLITEITTAAADHHQTVDQWCVELFEASLNPEEDKAMLVDRVYRLEQIVAQLTSGLSSPSRTRSASDVTSALTERHKAALDLVQRRWQDGEQETTAADLIGLVSETAAHSLDESNAACMARKVLRSLESKKLIHLRRLAHGLSARPVINDSTSTETVFQ
jgi:hypothetical protein